MLQAQNWSLKWITRHNWHYVLYIALKLTPIFQKPFFLTAIHSGTFERDTARLNNIHEVNLGRAVSLQFLQPLEKITSFLQIYMSRDRRSLPYSFRLGLLFVQICYFYFSNVYLRCTKLLLIIEN